MYDSPYLGGVNNIVYSMRDLEKVLANMCVSNLDDFQHIIDTLFQGSHYQEIWKKKFPEFPPLDRSATDVYQ